MSTIKSLVDEIIGIFIDDGSLALVILAVVAVAYLFSIIEAEHSYAAGGILYVGCLSALVENCFRTVWIARRK
jgi:hypothetical protein